MSTPWAIELDRESSAAAATLRLQPSVEVCECGQSVWLRGRSLDDDLARALRKLPARGRYEVLPGGELRAIGGRVPTGRLPDKPWEPLAQWIKLDPQPAALGGELVERLELRMVRGGPESGAGAQLTDLRAWCEYAERASSLRLKPLSFALDTEKRALIRGRPLPPIRGMRFSDHDGLLVPLGYRWQPAIEPSVVKRILRLRATDVALFHVDRSFELLAGHQFSRATRSAVRLSVKEERRHD